MHPILTERPDVVALREQEQALDRARHASRDRVEAAMAPYRAAMAAWRAEGERALLDGQDPPRAPARPDLGVDGDAANILQREGDRLRDTERRTLAAASPEIVAQAQDREAELLAQAAEHVAAVRSLLPELAGLLAVSRQVMSAAETVEAEATGTRSRPSPSDRLRPGVDLLAVIEAVESGASLLDPEPLPDRPAPRIEVDRDPVTPTPQLGHVKDPRPFGQRPAYI